MAKEAVEKRTSWPNNVAPSKDFNVNTCALLAMDEKDGESRYFILESTQNDKDKSLNFVHYVLTCYSLYISHRRKKKEYENVDV